MKATVPASIVAVGLLLAGCDLRYVLGFPQPRAHVAGEMPVQLAYREARGGLVILRGRVNDKVDVDFILDTGAPVSVLIDGPRTRALGLDTSHAKPLGDPGNPGTPIGIIQDGLHFAFGALALTQLTAVVIPEKTMPCREKFEEIGFAGVIGADLMKQFVVEIDPVAQQVRLHDPKTWLAPEGSTTIPITFRQGHPFVETRVTLADGRVLDAGMNVDIGMNRALTLAAGSHPGIGMPTTGAVRRSCYVNGVREEREGAPVSVTLGGARIEVASPVYSSAPNAVDGSRTSTIGIGLFKDRRLIIDYPGSRLVLA